MYNYVQHIICTNNTARFVTQFHSQNCMSNVHSIRNEPVFGVVHIVCTIPLILVFFYSYLLCIYNFFFVNMYTQICFSHVCVCFGMCRQSDCTAALINKTCVSRSFSFFGSHRPCGCPSVCRPSVQWRCTQYQFT